MLTMLPSLLRPERNRDLSHSFRSGSNTDRLCNAIGFLSIRNHAAWRTRRTRYGALDSGLSIRGLPLMMRREDRILRLVSRESRIPIPELCRRKRRAVSDPVWLAQRLFTLLVYEHASVPASRIGKLLARSTSFGARAQAEGMALMERDAAFKERYRAMSRQCRMITLSNLTP